MKLQGITINGYAVYATKNGIKVGSKGTVEKPSHLFAELSKPVARRLRKALHAAGYSGHAAQPRSVA